VDLGRHPHFLRTGHQAKQGWTATSERPRDGLVQIGWTFDADAENTHRLDLLRKVEIFKIDKLASVQLSVPSLSATWRQAHKKYNVANVSSRTNHINRM
jgi:hypothetical protein